MPEYLGSTKAFEVEVRDAEGDAWRPFGHPEPTTGTIARVLSDAERQYGMHNVRVVRVIVTREAL